QPRTRRRVAPRAARAWAEPVGPIRDMCIEHIFLSARRGREALVGGVQVYVRAEVGVARDDLIHLGLLRAKVELLRLAAIEPEVNDAVCSPKIRLRGRTPYGL